MTSDNQQLGGGTKTTGDIRTSGRRRMAGYQPQTATESNGATARIRNDTTAPTPQAEKASSRTVTQDSATTPPRQTRMGQQTTPVAAQQTESPAAAASHTPPARRRMGQSAPRQAPAVTTHEPAARQRMGQPAASAGPQRMGGPATQESSPAGRQRMGGAAKPAPVASEQEVPTPHPTATRRMGAPATPHTESAAPAHPGSAPSTDQPQTERPRWVRPVLITVGIVVVGLILVLGARWLRTLEPIQEFIATYDGHASQPEVAPAGIPAWLGWQHFLNMFFIVLIVRTGLQVRTERKPPAYWTAKKNSFFSPPGAKPKKVSLSQWLHQSLDVLWVVNGLIFVGLLIVTDHWMRIVPTSWDIFPNMVSGAIQYASLDWPTESGWVHYNALQVMAYFVTVFIAAPLAIISGIRISTWWPDQNQRLNKIYPVEVARAIHFPVMLYFVFFTIAHVFLVFFTGALRNLNHMYTSRDVVDWWGLVIFLSSLVVIAGAWFLTQPLFTRPVAAKMGQVTK